MDPVIITLIVCSVGLLAMVLYFIWFNRNYNIKVIVREVTNNRKIIREDRGRLYVDSDGVEKLKLLRQRVSVATPPSEAFEINNKGKRFIEMYKQGDREFQFLVDKSKLNTAETINAQVLKANKSTDSDKVLKANKSNDSDFAHLRTNQRIALVNQIIKAHSRRKKSWQDILIQTAPIFAVVVIVVMLMIFWADLAEPLLQMGDKLASISSQQHETQQLINQILQQEQLIPSEIGGNSP